MAEKGKKKGQEVESNKMYYYATIGQCLSAYVSLKADPNNKTAEGLLDQLKEIKEVIIEFTKNYKG